MSWSRKLLLGLFGTTLLVVGVFTARSIVRHGEVLPGVSVGGVDVGRLGRADLTEAILAIEDGLVASPVAVIVEGTSFPLDPAQVEFTLDPDAIADAALDAGRRSGFTQLADWITSRHYDIELAGRLSESAVDQLIDQWEAEGITDPAFNGAIRYEDGALIADPPRTGRQRRPGVGFRLDPRRPHRPCRSNRRSRCRRRDTRSHCGRCRGSPPESHRSHF